MKILLLGPPLKTIGGIQNYLNVLIKNLRKEEYTLIYFSQSFKQENKILFYFNFILQYIKYFIKIISFKPDIIQLNPSLIWASVIRDFIFLNISKITNAHCIIFFRGWRWEFYNLIKNKPLLKKIFIINLKKANKIIVLSKDFKLALVELGIDEKNIITTTVMVESRLYIPKNKTFDKPYRILYCGQIAKKKGLYELIDAVPKILENETMVNFIFIGDGLELQNLKKKTREMGIEKNILFTGYKSGKEKEDIFRSSHIFVLPSYTEGFPNVILEAMAAGLSIISTSVGGLKYVIRNGENGFLLESNPPTPEDISDNILKLMKNITIMKQISEINIKEAVEKYDVDVVIKKMEMIYQEMINKNMSSEK
jgi:glycosyltransferase involved in cell wall biosynthesis